MLICNLTSEKFTSSKHCVIGFGPIATRLDLLSNGVCVGLSDTNPPLSKALSYKTVKMTQQTYWCLHKPDSWAKIQMIGLEHLIRKSNYKHFNTQTPLQLSGTKGFEHLFVLTREMSPKFGACHPICCVVNLLEAICTFTILNTSQVWWRSSIVLWICCFELYVK
jgi:hypothetical protein